MRIILLILCSFFVFTTTTEAQGKKGLKGKGIKVNPPTVYWNVEQEYEATCPGGTTGTPVTVVVLAHTYQSSTSVSAANALALSAAQTQAEALLSCTPTPTTYTNVEQEYTANCPTGYTGTPVTITKLAGTYTSLVSIAEANAFALAAATAEANAALVCNQIVYYNTLQQFTASCPTGYAGSDVTVTKLANTYSSIISIADANSKALAAATTEATAQLVCTIIPTVYWNTQQSYTASCGAGFTGTSVTITKQANTYQSFTSVVHANQLALAAATSEANAALVCVPNTGCQFGLAPTLPASPSSIYWNDHTRTNVDMATSPYNVTAGNSTGLTLLNTNLSGYPKPSYNILSYDGNITYDWVTQNNRFLEQIYDFKISGRTSTTYQSTYNGVDNDGKKRPFWITSQFYPRFDYSTGNGGGAGFRFNTVSKGGNQITLTVTSDVSNFYVGQRVMIAGREMQYAGMPPNPQFLQYTTITNINGGVLTLADNLENDWNSGWWENSNYAGENFAFGKPRIFKLDNPTTGYHFPRHIVLDNMTLKPNSTFGDAALNMSADTVVYYNLTLQAGVSLHPSSSNRNYVIKGSFPDAEPDKDMNLLYMDSISTTGSITGGTGIKTFILSNSTAHFIGLSPRVGYFINNTLTRSDGGVIFYPQPEGIPSTTYIYKNNTATSTGNNEGLSNMCFTNYSTNIFTIDGTNIQAITGGFSIVDDGLNNPYHQIVKKLLNGSRIWTSAGKSLQVTDLTYNGRYNFTVSGGQPATSETYHMTSLNKIVDLGGNVNTTFGVPFMHESDARWTGDTTLSDIGCQLSLFDRDDFKWIGNGVLNTPWVGYIDSIEVNVISAYSGGASTAELKISKNGSLVSTINLKNTGITTIPYATMSGWTEFLKLETTDGGGPIDGINSGNYPNVQMRVVWKPYINP